jgi:hypothetical protein
MNRDDLFPSQTHAERAANYLKRGRPPRPLAPPQTDVLFDEPEHQGRKLVPLGRPLPSSDGLFSGVEVDQGRSLVPVDGWPDYRAQGRGGDAA